jgi:hypothetical protein
VSETGRVVEIPDRDVVRRVLRTLEDDGMVAAIGGSGLLAALGLADVVNDWDVTVDAPTSMVAGALKTAGVSFQEAPVGSGVYATAARFVVDGADHQVDVIVGFAVLVDGTRIELPTRITGRWRDLPLADPVVWERAYRFIGQTSKADLLARWLEQAPSPTDAEPPDGMAG